MLTKLAVSNYALISNLEVEFHSGLNSVTGETGAGKSIILGALGLILGNRADLSVLKKQDEKCIVEGVFDVKNYPLKPFFEENDLDYDKQTILRREITPAGKSRAFINDTPVNLKTLRSLGLQLIDIHSQHQNLELGNRQFQLNLVDTVAGSEKVLAEYQEVYRMYISQQKKLTELEEKSEKERADLDYWQFQFNQLDEAALQKGEQQELETELEQLNHAEEIKSVFSEVQQLLDDEQLSVINNLKSGHKRLESIQNYISEVPALAQRLESCLLELKDILDETEQLSENTEHDPARIEIVNDRLNLIFSLQQKHHVASVEELIELKDSFDRKIGEVTGYDDEIVRLKKELEKQLVELKSKAKELSAQRKKAFPQIEKAVLKDLHQLGMPKSRLEVEHETLPEFTPGGKDGVSFLFSANVDTPPSEISKVASGGEMSRLMLAIKNVLRTSKALPTVVFDEIDTGISGETAVKMGNILKQFSTSTQIINITHLPQIAAKGDAHFMVYKYENEGKTFTSIKRLSDSERIEELAKMVGGEKLTDVTLKAAQELLKG
ncbi:DNA replication and repair protein RecN [Mariniphaga anaerophila]|uniref:DNA repair protein RecN n=1 Tax=Mariniphaga anaerophila TaxID=1484053 RepID=A0A1M4XIM0_9BACT|nr:DNA repair protein RecN [Mariniphaga anaerophila]SHE93238.1 DNA replication and repair protein RecN [Mariniphaga anaerophila]